MASASWNGKVIAESEDVEIVENNVYFPPLSVKPEFLRQSQHTTACPWKGTASYYDVCVGDAINQNAAWYYPEPKQAASNIKGYVAFWKGVQVTH